MLHNIDYIILLVMKILNVDKIFNAVQDKNAVTTHVGNIVTTRLQPTENTNTEI